MDPERPLKLLPRKGGPPGPDASPTGGPPCHWLKEGGRGAAPSMGAGPPRKGGRPARTRCVACSGGSGARREEYTLDRRAGTEGVLRAAEQWLAS